MAKVISVDHSSTQKSKGFPLKDKEKKPPLFHKINYILMGIGLVVLALGYILLVGGGSEDPQMFNADVFNTRRLVVAPIMMLLGLIIEIFAIMYHPKVKNNMANSPSNENIAPVAE